MYSLSIAAALAGLLLGSAQADCEGDNVLRALRRYSASASPFCSTYIQKSTSATVTPSTDAYSTIITSTTITDASTTVVVLATLTGATTTTTTLLTSTITNDNYAKAKRDNASPLPSYVSQYSPSRVTSACSCLLTGQTLPTTTSTSTAPVQTATHLTTSVHVSHATVSTSTTSVVTTSTTITATATSLAVCGQCQSGNQVVQNPSFEEGGGYNKVAKWNISTSEEAEPFLGPVHLGTPAGNYVLDVNADPGVFVGNATQQLAVCAGASYALSFYFGLSNGGSPSSPRSTTLTIYLDDDVLFGPAVPCSDSAGTGCPINPTLWAYYQTRSVSPVLPKRCNPVLKLVYHTNSPQGSQAVNTLVDDILFTQI